jgi:hypothetical protein
MCQKIKKQVKTGVTSSEYDREGGVSLGGMRYYPAFGVKSRLVAPFRRFLGA